MCRLEHARCSQGYCAVCGLKTPQSQAGGAAGGLVVAALQPGSRGTPVASNGLLVARDLKSAA
eukprot:5137759-Prymnesium_polylepis.2